MADRLVFQLAFTDKFRLEEAFRMLLDDERVDSCTVEPNGVTARFVASQRAGAPLLERIYEVGGLRWCSRHAIQI